MNFFETSTRNLLTHEASAGVGHHVALSVVGPTACPKAGTFELRSFSKISSKAERSLTPSFRLHSFSNS